jgi:hypothetical protein
MHRDTPHDARRAADRVPTLTEVVELDSLFPATQVPFDEPSLGLRDPALVQGTTGPESRAASDFDTRAGASALSAEVLFELEQRIGAALEARLRQALAPALARAADSLIQEARQELAQTLRDLVDESVTRALESRTHL